MSEYSLDSLESVEEDSLEKHVSMSNDKCNLNTDKSTNTFVKSTPFYLNPMLTTSAQKKDDMPEANGIVRGANRPGGKNSIIANGGGFARQRRQEFRAARDEPWLCIRKRNDVPVAAVGGRCEEEGNANRRRTSGPTAKTTSTTTSERRSPGERNSLSKCSPCSNGSDMRADKKLGNVLATRTKVPPRTVSYSELYRRRFNILRYPRIRSPEGSTLSICGDSQLEELSLDEGRSSLPGTSRDDSSELSFYRRFVEGHTDRLTHTTRSCEVSNREISSNIALSGTQRKRCGSDSRLKKSTYRPYTVEEYRSLSVPKPDRSLGPDKDEVQIKREWLMRRRSYGDSVSARNREQILQRTRRLKDRENSRTPEMDDVTQECLLKRPVRCPKENAENVDEATSSRKTGTLEKTPCFGSSFTSYAVFEDSYLETLQQRHLQEKELADRLMRQVLNS